MSSIVISGDTSGAITLAAPAVSGTNTATLPAATGIVMVSGNMPAFSAYLNTVQNISSATFTVLQCNTEEFDTANAFNNTGSTVGTAPAYSFNPQVAGYYQINMQILSNNTATRMILAFYKNGAVYKQGADITANVSALVHSTLVYLNGTTDYVQAIGYITGSSAGFYGATNNIQYSWFNGSLVRAA